MKVLLILLSILLSGCTKVVSSGSYGPFAIGDSKSSALAKTKGITDVRSVFPVPNHEVYLENPSLRDLRQLDEDEGILVWLDHHPWPLRIEFVNDAVSRTWGASMSCHASQERMNTACSEIKRFSSKIAPGLSHTDTYKAIVTFQTSLSKQVGNFVAGLEPDVTAGMSDQEYRTFLLSKDGWEFNGLKELSKFSDPYYSRVTLYFKSDHLVRIKHWSEPFELP